MKENDMTLPYLSIIYEGKWYDTDILSSKFMKENDMILTYQT